jgi:hypothetical protein
MDLGSYAENFTMQSIATQGSNLEPVTGSGRGIRSHPSKSRFLAALGMTTAKGNSRPALVIVAAIRADHYEMINPTGALLRRIHAAGI